MSKLIRLHHFGGKEVLRAEELDISQPDAGEVLVSVRAASINPVDFKIRSGKYPAVKDDRLPYKLATGLPPLDRPRLQQRRPQPGDPKFEASQKIPNVSCSRSPS
jgi:hypothetical protein